MNYDYFFGCPNANDDSVDSMNFKIEAEYLLDGRVIDKKTKKIELGWTNESIRNIGLGNLIRHTFDNLGEDFSKYFDPIGQIELGGE